MDFVELRLGVGLVHTICASAEPHKKLAQVNMSRYFGSTVVAMITRSNAKFSATHQALMQSFLNSSEMIRLEQLTRA